MVRFFLARAYLDSDFQGCGYQRINQFASVVYKVAKFSAQPVQESMISYCHGQHIRFQSLDNVVIKACEGADLMGDGSSS